MTDAASAEPKNRRALLLMIGMLVFVIAAATTIYRLAEEGVLDLPALLGTSNRGVLINPPLDVSGLELRTERAGAQDYAALEPKWTVMVASSGHCDDRCQQSLYLTRQVRIALGRDQPRVRRVLVVGSETIESGLRDWLQREHEDLLVLHTTSEAIRQMETAAGVEQPAYFIADPQGWMMMAYRQQQSPKDLMADMKFLLKNSGS